MTSSWFFFPHDRRVLADRDSEHAGVLLHESDRVETPAPGQTVHVDDHASEQAKPSPPVLVPKRPLREFQLG